jgi:hypothetical protein
MSLRRFNVDQQHVTRNLSAAAQPKIPAPGATPQQRLIRDHHQRIVSESDTIAQHRPVHAST